MAARKLAAYVHVGGRVFKPGESPEKEFAEQITNPKAWADGAETGSADEGTTGYAGLKVDELKAEIEKRNADREDDAKLSTDGKKAELVAALEADDAAQAGS